MIITNRTFYGTDADTFYVDSTGQGWLIASVDGLTKPEKSTIPADAVELSEQVLDYQQELDAAEIESAYLNCDRCDAAWEVQYQGENLCHACADMRGSGDTLLITVDEMAADGNEGIRAMLQEAKETR